MSEASHPSPRDGVAWPAAGGGAAQAGPLLARPELALAGAFLGGVVVAFLLKRRRR